MKTTIHRSIKISMRAASKLHEFDLNVVRTTFATNFYGTLNVSNHLFPLIRPNGRLINISSSAGGSRILSDRWKNEFTKDDLNMDGLIGLMKEFEVNFIASFKSLFYLFISSFFLPLAECRRKRNSSKRWMVSKL